MDIFTVTEPWRLAFSSAHAGVLVVRNAANPASSPELDRMKAELVAELRLRFAGQDRLALEKLPTLAAYKNYYKRFNKTYHVQHQLESVAWKGKDIPRVAALVEAMFMAELKNLLLTAGHDLDTLDLPIRLEVSKGDETYTLLRGEAQTLKTGDMFMADGRGVISSILYGPDMRTQITPDTRQVVFTVYAPAGIESEAVRRHLEDIAAYVSAVSPQAEIVLSEVVPAPARK